jgi:tetratricopeptide (TPR) repeat protein
MSDPNTHADSGAADSPRDDLIPLWLAALVLILLLAVMGVGGYIIGIQITGGPPPSTEEEFEIQRWEDAVAQDPSDMTAVLSLGYAHQQAGNYDEALAEYERVLAEYPTETAALYNTGIIYLETGQDDEAEVVLWDVLELDEGHVLAAKALGELYAEQREYRSLVEAVRPVVEQNESAADLQYLMGFAYENLGRADWAEARYRLALKYFPDMKEAKEGLERLGVEE